jgi:hypothetical protein
MTTIIRRSALLASAAVLVVAFNALPASAQADAGTFALLAKITIKPGQERRFVEAMKAQVDASRAEPASSSFAFLHPRPTRSCSTALKNTGTAPPLKRM